MESPKEEKKVTKKGKVYNFTKYNFVVTAKNIKEAEEALKEFLKANKSKENNK